MGHIYLAMRPNLHYLALLLEKNLLAILAREFKLFYDAAQFGWFCDIPILI